MSQTLDVTGSCRFCHVDGYACATCRLTGAVALFCTGSIVIACAGFYLAYAAVDDWHLGWAARVIGLVLFCTVPGVIATVAMNFVSTRSSSTLTRRIAVAGTVLLGLGALEVVLVVAAWLLFAVFSSSGMY